MRRSVLNSFLVFRCCRAGADGDRDFPDFNAATSRAKPLEKVIGGLLLFVAAAYIVELIFSQPNPAQLGKGMVIPSLPTSEAVFRQQAC